MTEEDEAFDEIARKQGHWGGGYQAKRKAAADKLQEPAQEPVAWITPDGEGFRIRFSPPTNDVPLGWDALYTTPPQTAQEPVECLDCGSHNVGIPATYDSLINSVKALNT